MRQTPDELSLAIPRLPLVADLPDPAIRAMIERFTLVEKHRHALVVREGEPPDHVHLVLDGALIVEMRDHAPAAQVVGFLFGGDLLGAVQASRTPCTVRALVDSRLAQCGRADFEALCDAHPTLQHAVLQRASNDLAVAQDHLVTLGRKSAQERVASFLLRLDSRRARRSGAGDGVLWLPMRRTDIADHLGLTLETLSRVMSALMRQGVIRSESRSRIVIRDRAALAALAEQG